MYWIGHRFGHGLLAKHPKLGKFVGAQREQQFEQAIQRHGFKVMLLARFMVGVRGPVYLAAGVVRMPYRRFVFCDLTCATLVVTTFFGLSYLYGEEITNLLLNAEKTLSLVVLAITLGAWLWWMRRRRTSLIEKTINSEAEEGSLAADGTGISRETTPLAQTDEKHTEDVA